MLLLRPPTVPAMLFKPSEVDPQLCAPLVGLDHCLYLRQVKPADMRKPEFSPVTRELSGGEAVRLERIVMRSEAARVVHLVLY